MACRIRGRYVLLTSFLHPSYVGTEIYLRYLHLLRDPEIPPLLTTAPWSRQITTTSSFVLFGKLPINRRLVEAYLNCDDLSLHAGYTIIGPVLDGQAAVFGIPLTGNLQRIKDVIGMSPWLALEYIVYSQCLRSCKAKTSAQMDPEKTLAGLDGRKPSQSQNGTVTVANLVDADEALAFLTNHPRAIDIAIEGDVILDDPKQLKKLIRKIDLTIAPLLAAVYFLQFLDKTTLSYTAVMGIRDDTNLKGQDYSNLSMLFYIGTLLHPQASLLTVQAFSLPNSQHNTSHNTYLASVST